MSGFTLKASYNKKENAADVSPVINNTVNVTGGITVRDSPSETNISVPKLPTKEALKARTIPSITINDEEIKVSTIGETEEISTDIRSFESRLLSIYAYILSSQDRVLISNVVDKTGEIILTEDDLFELIQLATGKTNVQIYVEEPTVKCGCLGEVKTPFSSKITNIQIDNIDFKIAFNRIYNMFSQYKVSLHKVVVLK